MKTSSGMKPIMKVGRARSPTPSSSSTAAASRGANAHSSHVTRFGFVVPRRVSRRYTAVPSAPIARPEEDPIDIDHRRTVCSAPGSSSFPQGDTAGPPAAASFGSEGLSPKESAGGALTSATERPPWLSSCFVAFLGGLITGLSPCIVPVIPVIMAGGSTGTSRSRPYVIIAGLVVSFSLSVLFASSLLSFLHLPQDLLFWLGVAMLGLLSVGLLVPQVGEVIERPFARLGASRYANEGGGFVLGLSLGLVFVPCAGPVLTAISVAAAHHRVGATSLLVTLFYALGVTIPLLILAVVAQRATISWSSLRNHLPTVRRVAGVVLGVTTLAIAFNWLGALQRDVPGYTTALEDHIESTNSACTQLQHLSGEHQNQFAAANARLEGKKATCAATDTGDSQSGHLAAATTTTTTTTAPETTGTSAQKPAVFMASKTNLPNLGRAPNFTGITAWFNTPGDQPLTLSELRGKVVLIDFWTYSCINCQRALPHVEGWYNDYKKDGLVVVGVSAPRIRLRARGVERRECGERSRHRLPGCRRRQPGHLGRLQQRVLAGGLPDRPYGRRARLQLR